MCVADDYKRVCYYTNSAQHRPEKGAFILENINASLCTHIIYAFANLDRNMLTAFEWDDKSTGL